MDLRPALRSQWMAALVVGAAALALGHGLFTGVLVQGDAQASTLAVHHLQDTILGQAHWRAAPMAWPFPDSLTQADWMMGQALLGLPLRGLGIDPLVAYGWISLLGLALTAWACHLVARALTGPGPHTWVAALVGGLGPAHLAHLQHTNLVHHELAVGGALALWVGLSRRRPGLAVLGGALLGLAPHLGAYMGLHSALITLVVLAAAALLRQGDARTWVAGLAALGGALGSWLPAGLVYHRAARTWEVRIPLGERVAESWDPVQALVPPWLPVQVGGPPQVDPASPGLVALVLGGVGLVWVLRQGRWRGPWLAVLALLVCSLVLALGPVLVLAGQPTGLPLPQALVDVVLGSSLRAPARWLGVAALALSPLAALGARHLGERLPAWALGLGAAVLVLELPVPRAGPMALVQPGPALLAPAHLPEAGALWVRTGGGGPSTCDCSGPRLVRSLVLTGRPQLGGQWARRTEALVQLNTLANTWPSPEAAELFRALDVAITVEHPPFEGEAPGDCQVVDGHRVCQLVPTSPPLRPEALTSRGEGPVVALRYPSPPEEEVVEIRCGARTERHHLSVWALISTLRQVPALEITLDQPCQQDLHAPGATALYALDPTASWLPPLPGSRP